MRQVILLLMKIFNYTKNIYFNIFKKKFKERIIVFRVPAQIGDTIIAFPAFNLIKKRHPSSDIILLTYFPKKNYFNPKDICDNLNIFSDFLFYKKSLLSLIITTLRIRILRPSKLYYLGYAYENKQLFRDYLFFSWLGGINKIKGLKRKSNDLKINFNKEGKLLRKEKESNRLLKIVDEKEEFKDSRPFLKLTANQKLSAKQLLFPLKKYKYIIGIGHQSKFKSKNWPIEKFSSLLKEIICSYNDTAFVLLGGKENKISGDKLIYPLKKERILNLCGETNLIESAAILSLCKLFIGVDSGTMHLASAMNIKCIALFSVMTNPGVWEPFGEDNIIIRDNKSYYSREIGKNENIKSSMHEISEEIVFEEFKKIKG